MSEERPSPATPSGPRRSARDAQRRRPATPSGPHRPATTSGRRRPVRDARGQRPATTSGRRLLATDMLNWRDSAAKAKSSSLHPNRVALRRRELVRLAMQQMLWRNMKRARRHPVANAVAQLVRKTSSPTHKVLAPTDPPVAPPARDGAAVAAAAAIKHFIEMCFRWG